MHRCCSRRRCGGRLRTPTPSSRWSCSATAPSSSGTGPSWRCACSTIAPGASWTGSPPVWTPPAGPTAWRTQFVPSRRGRSIGPTAAPSSRTPLPHCRPPPRRRRVRAWSRTCTSSTTWPTGCCPAARPDDACSIASTCSSPPGARSPGCWSSAWGSTGVVSSWWNRSSTRLSSATPTFVPSTSATVVLQQVRGR